MIEWYVAVLTEWPGERTVERKSTPFRVTRYTDTGTRTDAGVDWSGTLDLLERELRHLNASNVVLQGFFDKKRDIRNDGSVRADARPYDPGVVLTFDLPSIGNVPFACDTYNDWRANVRAIAKSLEALRAVDRYGVTKRGEQYRGFGQLPPAGGSTVTMKAEEAAQVIAEAIGGTALAVLAYPNMLPGHYRDAAKRTHPDTPGGSDRAFYRVQEAKKVLEAHFGGGS